MDTTAETTATTTGSEAAAPLAQMAATTVTDWWNDSCAIDDLEYAIARGAVGATSNPSIVLEVLRKEPDPWRARARELFETLPTWSEAQITWQIVEEMAVCGAKLLEPVFERTGGAKGRLSIQTNPKLYRDPDALVEQAVHFAGLAPNLHVKIPATEAGIAAVEEATRRGVNINATVSFTLPQALAVAEAVERGLADRRRNGHDTDSMHPVCTLMVGRLDDWLKVVADRRDILVTPGALDWAGVAVAKKAYGIFRERGYRSRIIVAAYRNRLHWTEFVGGDLIMTMTHQWQARFNGSGIEPRQRIDEPVDRAIVAELYEHLGDFRRAFDADGLRPSDFDTYGATARTLRQFIASYDELESTIRSFVLPDPDRHG